MALWLTENRQIGRSQKPTTLGIRFPSSPRFCLDIWHALLYPCLMLDTHKPINKRQLIAAHEFARKYLGIKSFGCFSRYRVLPYDAARTWLGIFHGFGLIEYNGMPSYGTIFHEAVHYHQYQRGEDLKVSYARIKTFGDYWNEPFEVEARDKAAEMIRRYLPSIGIEIPVYLHPDNWEGYEERLSAPKEPWPFRGLRSDHTYY